MKTPKKKPIIIANDHCVDRLRKFERELKTLCDRYLLDLRSTYNENSIYVIDRIRPRNTGWPSVASFSGVDKRGVFSSRNYGSYRVKGIDLSDVPPDFEEDHAKIEKAHAQGRYW